MLEFGDKVKLVDIPVSIYFSLGEYQQETYELYHDRMGLITEQKEEGFYYILFGNEVVKVPIKYVYKVI